MSGTLSHCLYARFRVWFSILLFILFLELVEQLKRRLTFYVSDEISHSTFLRFECISSRRDEGCV
jgi:hypothetical protein